MITSEGKVIQTPDHLELTVVEGPVENGFKLLPFARFTTETLSVGRTKASRVHIKDSAVSERHAEFRWTEDGWVLVDCGSTNGTFVNGVRLDTENDLQNRRLKDGDIIQFGTDTKVRAEIVPQVSTDISVEQFLKTECHRLMQRIKGRFEQSSGQLLMEWEQEHRKHLQDLLVA